MNYEQTVQWMFHQLPMYQLQGASAYRKDLTNAILFSDYLGNPERGLKLIHVAGTNGKGSTSHMLASILQEAGYKTGLYTSPHLKDFRERIKIGGHPISELAVTNFVNQHKAFFENNNLSFFEMSVGLAFDYFKAENVDVAVIETGMGGRLDATNIITPILSVITNIGMDHTQFLGNSLQAIAGEKAGIIKQSIPVIIGEYSDETRAVFEKKAAACASEIFFASDELMPDYESDLKGDYQSANKKTVQKAIQILKERSHFQISEGNLQSGFLNVVKNTGLFGRWQKLNSKPTVICDTAHNYHGLSIVIKQILNTKYDHLHIVLGFVNDKKLDELLPLFPKEATYYFCAPHNARALNQAVLQTEAKKWQLQGEVYISVSAAYLAAMENAAGDDFIYIGGSTFVVAEIM